MFKKYYLCLLLFIGFISCSTTQKAVVETPKKVELSDSARRQFDYFFYEGLRQKDDQQYDQALETFRLCIVIDSLDAGVQSEMGILYAITGFNDEAVKCLEKSIRLDPTNWWYNVRLISMYAELKNTKRAIEIAGNLQRIYPNREEVYTMLSSFYKDTKEYEKSIAAYDKLESLTGINETSSFEKFQLYMQLNKPQKGVAEIDKLVNKYPTETRYKVLRGDIFMQQKMPDKAFEIYQNVLKEDPENPYVYVSLSEYYKSANKPEKAMESIVSALKSDKLDVETKVSVLGQYVEKLAHDSTKLVETESLFKLLVDRYPMEEQVHGYYAVFLQYQKRNAEALSELETMININPKNDQTWIRMIQIYIGDKNFKQIIATTTKAIENLPKLPVWYFYRGIAQYQLADYREALATYQKGLPLIAAEQADMKSDFYAQIADIYYKFEKKDSAFVNYEASLAANPKNIMVMNNYAYYMSLDKTDLKKAEKMSAKTVELEPKNSTYLDTYAWILYQEGNFSLAKFYIERAIDNLPKNEDSGILFEHYGDILWMNGKDTGKDDAKALQMWQKSYDSGNKTDALKTKIDNKGWKR
ncbi:MAG: tetratricopeptide repeat protein [Paludibacter sp.]|nr:tetratricopeptide repeat protein [Paludibacter sp.]